MDKLKARIDQKELRKLMAERRQNQSKANAEKINSPLAKYDSKGNLSCVLCRANIKSSTVWKVHINSKQHKENVTEAKELKDEILKSAKELKTQKNIKVENNKITLTNAHNNNDKQQTITAPSTSKSNNFEEKVPVLANTSENALPEQFFDQPPNKNKLSKDPQDEEWERFQREIKEETVMSNIIIAGEQIEATVDRQIIEIDEQIHHWSKVLDLEEKLERINRLNKIKQQQQQQQQQLDNHANDSDSDSESVTDMDQTLDDLLNWRCKSLK